MKHLILRSGSRAEDAGYLALADIASITDELDVDYRLVGGQMTTLLVAAYEVSGVPARETADADLAAEPAVVAHPDLPRLLAERDYRPSGASNRFARPVTDGQAAVIDVLAPSPDGRLHPNRRYGDLYLDEIPGLLLALARPPVSVTLEVELQTGRTITMLLRLPDPLSALALKALAYASPRTEKDAVDVWRLLAVAHSAGTRPRTGEPGPASAATPPSAAPRLRRSHQPRAACHRHTADQHFTVAGPSGTQTDGAVPNYSATGVTADEVDIALIATDEVDRDGAIVSFDGTNPGGAGNVADAGADAAGPVRHHRGRRRTCWWRLLHQRPTATGSTSTSCGRLSPEPSSRCTAGLRETTAEAVSTCSEVEVLDGEGDVLMLRDSAGGEVAVFPSLRGATVTQAWAC